MQFYNIDKEMLDASKIEVTSSNAKPIDVRLMSALLMDLSQDANYKSINQINNVLYSKCGDFSSNVSAKTGVIKNNKETISYLLPESGVMYTLTSEHGNFYLGVRNCQVFVTSTSLEAQELIEQDKARVFNSSDEAKAYAWLENENTGTSSLSLCKSLFPSLSHRRLDSLEKITVPQDFDDLSRCIKFVQCVPGALQMMKSVNINAQWSEIIKNWDSLCEAFNSSDKKIRLQGSALLKSCITTGVKIGP